MNIPTDDWEPQIVLIAKKKKKRNSHIDDEWWRASVKMLKINLKVTTASSYQSS